MLKLFLQPYPLWDNKPRRLVFVISISLFVFLFLYVFKPFGLDRFETPLDIRIFIGYGLTSFVLLLLMQFIIPSFMPYVFNEDVWKVYKEIVFTLIIISTIGVGNLLYSSYVGFVKINTTTLAFFEMVTLIVALFPVTIIVLLKQNYLLRKNLKQSSTLSEKLYRKTRIPSVGGTIVELTAENSKDTLSIDVTDLYYLAAADNYIEVHLIQQKEMKKILLRCTLKNAQDNLKRFSNFYRCHRTYIVNLDKVQSVTGNSQGYRLVLFNIENSIPVSRALTREVTQRLSI